MTETQIIKQMNSVKKEARKILNTMCPVCLRPPRSTKNSRICVNSSCCMYGDVIPKAPWDGEKVAGKQRHPKCHTLNVKGE